MTSPKQIEDLALQLAAVHRELGIPASYARDRQLTLQLEAERDHLVHVGVNDVGRPIRLIEEAAESWTNLQHAAAWNEIELIAISGFRGIDRQIEIFREKLAAGQQPEAILRYLAAPGYSEHHTGRALDIGAPDFTELDEEFAHTSAFHWLGQHAHEFGFTLSYPRDNPHGIVYEPWHWCWRP